MIIICHSEQVGSAARAELHNHIDHLFRVFVVVVTALRKNK
jgi:hypothetical protein